MCMMSMQRQALRPALGAPNTRARVCVSSVRRKLSVPCRAERDTAGKETADTSPALKAVWYAAEVFGKVVGKNDASSAAAPAPRKMSRVEMLDNIKKDYSASYFVSGAGEMAAYADDCVFADPFVAFKGTQRFKQNVGNLGGQMRDIKLNVYDFRLEGEDKVHTKWRFSCLLNLPWKPALAAAGGTTHVMDLERGQIVEHIERWDVEPSKVVQQLLKPSNKVPTNSIETFLLAGQDRDVKGMWNAASPFIIRLSLLSILLSSLGSKLISGEVNVPLLLISASALVFSISTEVLKFSRGMQGGETGTGGRF